MMRKINCLSTLCLVLFAAAVSFAQAPAEGERPPLSYTLTPNARAACEGQPVSFTATLRNTSDKAVAIDPNGLGYSGTISITGPTPAAPRGPHSGPGTAGGSAESWIGDPAPNYEPPYRVIWPGETYSRTFTQNIEREYRNSKVEFQMTYGQFIRGNYRGLVAWRGTVDSNTVKIIYRCGR